MDRRGSRQEASGAPLTWRPAPARGRDGAVPRGDRRRAAAVPAGARRGSAETALLPWLPAAGPDPGRRPARPGSAGGGRRPRPARTDRGGPPVPRRPGRTGAPRRSGPGPFGAGVGTARAAVSRIRDRGPVAVGGAVVLVGALVVAVVAGVVHALSGGPAVSTPFLSYTAPAGWTAEAGAVGALDTPTFTGAVRGPGYDCGGETHVRGFAAAALLPVDPAAAAATPGSTAAGGPADRAERLVRWFAAAAYGGAGTPGSGAPEVAVAPARPVRVDGVAGPVDGSLVEATVRAPARDGCAGVDGTVVALAAPVGGGAATLLVAADTAGGPADPAPVDRATLDAVLASVRLGPAEGPR